MHRNQKKNNIILFLLMMFGMFLGSCKGPLNLKDDLLNAQKAYITISTNLSDSEARTVLPTGFNTGSTGLSWVLTGTKEGSSTAISYKWEDEKDSSGEVIKSAYNKMTSSDTVIELEEGKWTFELTVNNTEGKKVLQSNLTQTISSDTDNLNFVMQEASGDGVAQGQIEFTLTFPAGTVGKVAATLTKYGETNASENPQPLTLQTVGAEDFVTYTNTVDAGTYMLKLDLQQQDPADTKQYETINTYTCLIRVAPGLLSKGSDKLTSLAKLYKIKYELDGGTMPENVTKTSYNQYTKFKLLTPERPGYEFLGWYTNEACSEKVDVDDEGYFSISIDTTLYAKWEEVYITNFSLEEVTFSQDVTLEIINSTDNTSYGKIVNEIYSRNNIWDKYLRLSEEQFVKGANYSVSLALKADTPTVVAISAARADMYFTVTDKWQEYTFETGFIETDLVENVNAISMGIAKTSGLCIANVTVNKITDAEGKFVDNGLPILSFNLGNAPIEYYLEKLPKDDQGLLKPIICVETNNINKGYQITINTKENDDNPDSDSITVNLRDYVTPGLNMASFILESPYSSSIEGYPITNLDGSGNTSKDELKSLDSNIINTWSNSSKKDSEEIQYVVVPVPSYENENDPVPYLITGLLKNVENESSTVTIKNFNIEKIINLENTDKTFAIRVGENWSKLFDLSTPIEISSSPKGTELQVVLTDKRNKNDEEWTVLNWGGEDTSGTGIPNSFYCQFKVYNKADNSNLNVSALNGDSCTVSGAEKIKLSLTDDFTVLIEEVTDTNNNQSSSGGTGGVTEVDSSGDLELYSVNDVEWLHIKTSKGLEKYRDIINGTLANDIKFSNGRTFSAANSSFVNAELKDNVEVSDWIPIGIDDNKFTVFSFLGNGHTITINNIDSNYEGEYVGLFGYVGNMTETGVKISDLTVKGTLKSDSAKFVGGFVGCSNGVTIENCVNFASLKGTERIGGIVGCVEEETTNKINKCVNAGDIQKQSSYAWYGGIVAYAKGNITISDCINLKNLPSSGAANGAGIIYCEITNNYSTYEVNSCINTGSISMPGPYAIANTGVKTNSYYNSDNINSGSIADSSKFVIAKTTSDLCDRTKTDLSDDWSFAEEGEVARYPLPDLSGVFESSSGGESIWAQICVAAQIQDSASAAVKPSDF